MDHRKSYKCAYGNCDRPVLYNATEHHQLCKKHARPNVFYEVGGVTVRKEYIKKKSGRYVLSEKYHQDIKSRKNLCCVCKGLSVVKVSDQDDYVCSKHINPKSYYDFRDKKLRGDMLLFQHGMLYEKICTYHYQPFCDVGVCNARLVDDELLCEGCISGHKYDFRCATCNRLVVEYGSLVNVEDKHRYCFSCISPHQTYIYKDIAVSGSRFYLSVGGKTGSLRYLNAKGYEYHCQKCNRYFEKPDIMYQIDDSCTYSKTAFDVCPYCHKYL